jgi:hypothetical protein
MKIESTDILMTIRRSVLLPVMAHAQRYFGWSLTSYCSPGEEKYSGKQTLRCTMSEQRGQTASIFLCIRRVSDSYLCPLLELTSIQANLCPLLELTSILANLCPLLELTSIQANLCPLLELTSIQANLCPLLELTSIQTNLCPLLELTSIQANVGSVPQIRSLPLPHMQICIPINCSPIIASFDVNK